MSYRLPTLNGLRAFEAAARHGGFKEAARELGVTPGAVSQQVKTLEGVLGLRLFRRLHRGLVLTGDGEAYLPPVSTAFRMMSDATETVAPALRGRKLRFGVAKGIDALLPNAWPEKHSDLAVVISRSRLPATLDKIATGEVDAILRWDDQMLSGLAIETLAEVREESHRSRIVLVCKPALSGCSQYRALVRALRAILKKRSH
jgi:LysR family transcriptional regulator, glycine cleavage system transcriptional activator